MAVGHRQQTDRRTVATRPAKKTKSALLRDALLQVFAGGPSPGDPAREARRQSLLVSRRASELEAIDFIEHAADTRGWR